MLVTGGVNFEKQTTTPNWYNRRPRILYKQTVLKSVELLNMDGTWNCPMPQLPVARFGHSQAGAVTCAGRDGSYEDTVQKSCVTLSSDWEQTHTLSHARWGRWDHSAWRSSAWKSSIRRFVITEKAPTRAFSWLKAATTAFTFMTPVNVCLA